jgi:hypothetical protein
MTDAEKLDKVHSFLSRVGNGYVELSHDKVQHEYLFFKQRARELLFDLFPIETTSADDKPLDMDF